MQKPHRSTPPVMRLCANLSRRPSRNGSSAAAALPKRPRTALQDMTFRIGKILHPRFGMHPRSGSKSRLGNGCQQTIDHIGHPGGIIARPGRSDTLHEMKTVIFCTSRKRRLHRQSALCATRTRGSVQTMKSDVPARLSVSKSSKHLHPVLSFHYSFKTLCVYPRDGSGSSASLMTDRYFAAGST